MSDPEKMKIYSGREAVMGVLKAIAHGPLPARSLTGLTAGQVREVWAEIHCLRDVIRAAKKVRDLEYSRRETLGIRYVDADMRAVIYRALEES